MENKKSRILIEAEKYVERQLSRLDEQDRLHWYASQLEQAYIAGAESEAARWARFNYEQMMKQRQEAAKLCTTAGAAMAWSVAAEIENIAVPPAPTISAPSSTHLAPTVAVR